MERGERGKSNRVGVGLTPNIGVRGSPAADMRSGLILGFLICHTEAGPIDSVGMSAKDPGMF